MSRYRLAAICLALVALLVGSDRTAAHGGKVRVDGASVGPYRVTVFTSPTPIRVGTVDVSALLERGDLPRSESELVQDARITVTAEPVGRDGEPRTFEATHDHGPNKLFYAVDVELPSEGKWRLTVDVGGEEGGGHVEFVVTAEPADPVASPLLLTALVPAAAILWWLSRRRHFARRG